MLRVYLAGSMGGRSSEEVIRERQKAAVCCERYGMMPVDPGRLERKQWGKKISLKTPQRIMDGFVDKDLFLIRRSDVLLVLTGDSPSDGTWTEKTYAKMIGLPVVLVSPKRASGRLVGWANSKRWADKVCPDIESAVKYIARTWGEA